MVLSKCKATTKSSLSKHDFDEVCELFLNNVLSVVVMEDIPPSLIINGPDRHYFVSASQWTMEVKGAHRVEIAGLNDKHQMTMVLAGTASRDFLPLQMIYSG